MKQSINLYDFRRAFEQSRPDNFSYEGLEVLFDSLENLEDDTGIEIELDVVAICCDFQESTVDEVIQDYDIDVSDDEVKADIVRDHLQDNAFFCGETSNGNMVFQSF